jgi:hypothetical protein
VGKYRTCAICVIPIHGIIEEVLRNIKNKGRTFSTDFFWGLMIPSASRLCSISDRIITIIEQLVE